MVRLLCFDFVAFKLLRVNTQIFNVASSVSVGDNAAMWKMWLELPKDIHKGWLVAGNILFDMNLIHKSKEREV